MTLFSEEAAGSRFCTDCRASIKEAVPKAPFLADRFSADEFILLVYSYNWSQPVDHVVFAQMASTEVTPVIKRMKYKKVSVVNFINVPRTKFVQQSNP